MSMNRVGGWGGEGLHSDGDAWYAAASDCGRMLVCLCVGVNDASVCDWFGEAARCMDALVAEMYHHIGLNDASVDWT